MSTPLQQLARAMTMAGVSTYLALAMHVMAGGDVPPAGGVALAALAALAAAASLARKRLTRWRIAVAAVVSQACFHALFVMSGAHAASAEADAAMARAMAAMGHQMTSSAGADAMAGMQHGGATMIVGHAAAAVVTYLLLRHAELWWSWLLAGAGRLRRALTPLTAPVPTRAHVPPVITRTRAALSRAVTVPLGMRAPPLRAV